MTVLDAPTATATATSTRNPVRWIVFAVVLAANLMDIFDATIVNVAGRPSTRIWAARPTPCNG